MGDSKSIVNLGDLTKPANTLIEKISDAMGTIFKPQQIVRLAEAEAKAEMIRVKTGIQVTDLQRRAMQRFILEEEKKQNNIENITAKALPNLEDSSSPESVEDDWITSFFDKCRLISDVEMQTLWARILAGEVNSPGNYSKRTIDLLSSMDKSDAILFSRVCSFGFRFDTIYPLIYDVSAPIYTENDMNFSTLSHLESIGLVRFDSVRSFARQYLPQEFAFDYFGEEVRVRFRNQENENSDAMKYMMSVGNVMLTQVGEQLAPISGAEPIRGLVAYVKAAWLGLGYNVD